MNTSSKYFFSAQALSLVFASVVALHVHAQPITVAHGLSAAPLPVIRINTIVFAPASSVAKNIGVPWDSSRDDVELILNNRRAAFRSGNPFVAIMQGSEKKILQLAYAPVVRAGQMYLPLDATVRLLQRIGVTNISYDPKHERFTIAAPPAITRDTARNQQKILRRDSIRPNNFVARAKDSAQEHPPPVRRDTIQHIAAASHAKDSVQQHPRPVQRDTIKHIATSAHAKDSSGAVPHKLVRRDSVRAITFESKTNGVLVRLDYRGAGVVKVHGSIAAFNAMDIQFGGAVVDTNKIFNNAKEAVSEKYFSLENDLLTMHVILYDSLQAVSRQLENGHISFLLRTSRATKFSKEQRAGHERWKMDVVVLDAGHGGKDTGAQGLGGTDEKDVTLAVVLKLGQLLEKAGIHVVYTRTTDVFVELYRRAQIANEAKGKLFISVHCNSMPTKPNPANGFESYILRPGKNETAVRVAQRENNVIGLEDDRNRYGSMSEEAFIVAAMAQSGFVKHSEEFATQVQQELAAHCPGHKNNGVSQAGFLVLVGASMPNILIETGYVSNTREEHMLGSAAGQTHLAEGIAAAVKKFKGMYEKRMAR